MNGALVGAGWSLRHCCVVDHLHGEVGPDEWVFNLSDERLRRMIAAGRRPDVDASYALLEDGAIFAGLARAIAGFDPDLFVFHQPWLWPGISRMLDAMPRRPRLIYSSQNQEAVLAADTLKQMAPAAAARVIARAEGLERDLLSACDGLVCVSEQDRAGFSFEGPTLVLRNGVWPFAVGAAPHGAARPHEALRPARLLFVGSAHPPNAEGFVTLLPDLDFLHPGQSIVVAGGVGTLLESSAREARYAGRLKLTGPLDKQALEALLVQSDGIILPIVSGGGTNLKTAEALYSQKAIVATSRAFRGFEEYLGAPGVHIADTSTDFKAIVRHLLTIRSTQPVRDADALTWPALLPPLAAFVDRVMAGR